MAVSGVWLAGFTIAVLPQARAGAIFHDAITAREVQPGRIKNCAQQVIQAGVLHLHGDELIQLDFGSLQCRPIVVNLDLEPLFELGQQR